MVLAVTGEVDLITAPSLEAAAATALDTPDVTTVIIDLTRVEFFASAGLAVLITVDVDAAVQGAALRVVVDHHRPVVEPLRITGLDQHLALFQTLTDALSADGDPLC